MNDADRVARLTDDIAANLCPGGSAFARAAAELIALRVRILAEDADASAVRATVTTAAEWTAKTKPSMAVVRNVAELAMSLVADPAADASTLRSAINGGMRSFIERSTGAVSAIGAHADELFADGSTVLIHSYSASLESLLRVAAAHGRHFTLLVTESRPYRESRRLIEAVLDSSVDASIDIVVYSDAAVAVAAAGADLALVGADSVYTDGSFANKTGSLPLALACRENRVPLYVATELAKVYFGDADDVEMELRPAAELSEGWSLIESGRVRVWNQFFERVEAGHVHRYVTEVGLLAPGAVRAAASESWRPAPVATDLDPTAALSSGV